mmetsp:Transcript_53023/g.123936  ORF Transcript_53023/g.123936 Transcript_53023/m.123936 type:complete len:240 (-) Transcript_53023:23-742(-)
MPPSSAPACCSPWRSARTIWTSTATPTSARTGPLSASLWRCSRSTPTRPGSSSRSRRSSRWPSHCANAGGPPPSRGTAAPLALSGTLYAPLLLLSRRRGLAARRSRCWRRCTLGLSRVVLRRRSCRGPGWRTCSTPPRTSLLLSRSSLSSQAARTNLSSPSQRPPRSTPSPRSTSAPRALRWLPSPRRCRPRAAPASPVSPCSKPTTWPPPTWARSTPRPLPRSHPAPSGTRRRRRPWR